MLTKKKILIFIDFKYKKKKINTLQFLKKYSKLDINNFLKKHYKIPVKKNRTLLLKKNHKKIVLKFAKY